MREYCGWCHGSHLLCGGQIYKVEEPLSFHIFISIQSINTPAIQQAKLQVATRHYISVAIAPRNRITSNNSTPFDLSSINIPPTKMTTSSERPSASSARQNSTSSTDSTLNKTWRKIKEHHEGLNGAFATYYGGGRRSQEAWTTPKYSSSRRTSISSQELEHKPLVGKKEGLGQKLKHMVKEHHRSVNNAYRAFYGY